METGEADLEPQTGSEKWEKENFINNLPQDVRHRLLTQYLDPNGVSNLERAGSSMVAVCKDDAIWQKFCSLEMKVKIKDLGTPHKYFFSKPGELGTASAQPASPISFYTVYTKIIYPLRGLFDCALCSSSSIHGSVLTLTYKNGAVYGEFWYPPAIVTGDMKSSLAFLLYIDEQTDKFSIQSEFSTGNMPENAFMNEWKIHGCDRIIQLKDLDICVVREPVERIIFNFHHRASDFIQASRSRLGLSNVATNQYVYWNIRQSFANSSVNFSQSGSSHGLSVGLNPSVLPEALPEGFFKGFYGSHGNELILVQLIQKPNSSRKLTGLKVTGDPNVPAGKVTFEFDVFSNVHLNLEQQDDSLFLENLQNGEHFVENGPQIQPFRLPNFITFSDRFEENLLTDLPQTCIGRLVGNGIIAFAGYQDPQNVVVHLVIFSPSRFLLLWLGQLNFAALFEKISENDQFFKFC